jgi:hypothetical protein
MIHHLKVGTVYDKADKNMYNKIIILKHVYVWVFIIHYITYSSKFGSVIVFIGTFI